MLKRLTHQVSSVLTHWLPFSLVLLLSQYLLDPLIPGVGQAHSTMLTVLANFFTAFAIALAFHLTMASVARQTRKRCILDMSESTRLLDEILKQTEGKPNG